MLKLLPRVYIRVYCASLGEKNSVAHKVHHQAKIQTVPPNPSRRTHVFMNVLARPGPYQFRTGAFSNGRASMPSV